MITLQNNPIICDESEDIIISFAQTKDTLIDTDIYSRFVYSIENRFRKSTFYRSYKDYLMRLGMYRDARHAAITSEMCPIEMHHNFIELKFMTIMIIEYLLNTKGCVTTFEVIQLLEDAHRNNEISVIMLSETEHAAHHSDPTDFISISQTYGDPFRFLEKYGRYMTLDIGMKLLLHLNLEEQYGLRSFSPNEIRARDEILSWVNMCTNQNLQY